MKPDLKNIDDIVNRYLPSAPADEMASDAARVLQRLRSTGKGTVDGADDEPFADFPLRSGPSWQWIGSVAAVAAVLVAIIATTVVRRGSSSASFVQSATPSLYRFVEGKAEGVPIAGAPAVGEAVRATGDSGAMLALLDGSRVEMRLQSELALERADDGIRIRLRSGSIIVNAAKQPTGHLYVQTKDMTVTVVGTVFLVNAEEQGSHVAVIEGEVRVRQRATETKLRPGQQVSTSPTLAVRPVKEEIAWSRHADAHLAILASFEKGMAATAGPLRRVAPTSPSVNAAADQAAAAAPTPEFEEASIRPCDPDNIPPAPEGARGGGPNSLQMTPGRTHALCLTVATLIRTAYGYAPGFFFRDGGRGPGMSFNNVYGLGVEDGVRVRGGPDWVRSARYTIDAVAQDAADADTMRGAMLRALLERRFQLKVHIETEQIPAFALTAASGGLKMKEGTCTPPDASFVRPSSPTEGVRRNLEAARRGATTAAPCGVNGALNGPNLLFVGAGAGIPPVSEILGVPIIDRTGLSKTARFNYVLEFAPDESTAGPLGGAFAAGPRLAAAIQLANEPAAVARGQNIFTALEQQLGLKLEPARAPREFIVVDHVERPSPN